MKKILIIEDDADILFIYREVFTEEKLKVTTASTGKQALKLLTKDMPDLILLDIMFPGNLSGYDVLKIIQNKPKLAKIPVIILTNLDAEINKAQELGAKDFIVKVNTPVTDIISIVKKHLLA